EGHGDDADPDRGVAEGFDAEDLGLLDEERAPGGIGEELAAKVAEDGEDAVDILLVGDLDVDDGAGPGLGQVADLGDLAVGDDVDDAVDVAEDGGAEGDLLDHPVDVADADHVADAELSLDE